MQPPQSDAPPGHALESSDDMGPRLVDTPSARVVASSYAGRSPEEDETLKHYEVEMARQRDGEGGRGEARRRGGRRTQTRKGEMGDSPEKGGST